MTEPSFNELAALIRARFAAGLPPAVLSETKRSLFNAIGVGLGASTAPEVTRLTDLACLVGPGPFGALGRAERLDRYHAALVTGFSVHLDDFDDTHLNTVIHPGAACLGAAWAVASAACHSGMDVLTAFGVGCEAQLRLGVAISPDHYNRGWHITGTCGVIGGAVTAGLLLGLNVGELTLALRLSAVQTVGHREAFGTEVKALHAGKAAANGVLAAATALGHSAREHYSMTPFLRALADKYDPSPLLIDSEWELLSNTYKPYPCGIVAHPGIDAAIAAHARGVDAAAIVGVRYRCHELVPELMGNPVPVTGLQARFSAIHGVASALLTGASGLPEFTDDFVRQPGVVALRQRVELVIDPTLDRDQAALEISLADGSRERVTVDAARGSRRRPLTNSELVGKVERLVQDRFTDDAAGLWASVNDLDATAESLQSLILGSTPVLGAGRD